MPRASGGAKRHEESETVQSPSGRWINVIGRNKPGAGTPLKPLWPEESKDYPSVKSAVSAAELRSKRFREGDESTSEVLRERAQKMRGFAKGGKVRPQTRYRTD